ncbi:hypothetical protein [Olsenella sp. HMSC062G07]|uniref:hypothetical protein n=1 Tax=Olsenella sp. HMSC062G07 TaxID=1739330 RepID=UPI0008A56945|nr:hypothetical protein [Olsenella sp. HMSC062G07]OFK23954.1 hypothetical protein HMPREF2826_08870 [Olsenella sp. HMSC062G07]
MTADGRTPQQDDDRSGAGKLAEEVSFSTIIASALAAVTSFLLQSKIGLAGSLIGVGVAAAASALASQVYKWLLRTSATRIRDNLGVDEEAPDCEPADVASDTVVRQRPGQAVSERRMAPASIRRAVARRRSKRRVKTALVFTAVVAVLAVLVYAAIVSLATSGRGIGSTETPLSSPGSSTPSSAAPTASQTPDAPGADDAHGTAASEPSTGDAQTPGTPPSAGGDAATTTPDDTAGDATAGGDATSGTANGAANGRSSDASSPTTSAPNGAADSTTGAGSGGAGAKGSKVGASS